MLDSSSYDRRVMFDGMVGNSTNEFFSNFTKSSEFLKKEVKNYFTLKTEELHKIIYEKITRKNHKHKSPEKGDGTLKKCIKLLEQGADPNILTELEKLLSKQIESEKSPKKEKHYNYYIENFLPALKAEVVKSEELVKLSVFNNERKQSQRPQTIRGKIVEIILRIINKSDRISSQVDNTSTPKRSSSSSDSRLEASEESLSSLRSSSLTSVTSISSEEDLDSILSSAKKNNNLQKEEMQPEQVAAEEPQMQESENSGDQAKEESAQCLISMTGSKVKNPIKSDNYENSSEFKQLNYRNLHVALVTGCALLAIGGVVAGAMTSGLVGAGLFVMSAVFATAAAAELRSNFLSSKLTSINVKPLIDSLQHGKN